MKKLRKSIAHAFLVLIFSVMCVTVAMAATGTPEKISSGNVTPNSVTVSWSAVKNASGYTLYRYNYDRKLWTSVKRTTALKFTDKKLSPGKKYAYRVRAYTNSKNKRVYGEYSSKVYVKTPPEKVKGIGTQNVLGNTIVLKWSKAKGADGYAVYKRDKKTGKYSVVADVKINTASVKLEDVVGVSFKIRAYSLIDNKKVYAGYSSLYTNNIALSNVEEIKLSSVTQTSYKISWKKVNGANGYQLYRYDTKDKKWRLSKTVNSNSVKLSGFKSADMSDYKVRAYCVKNGKSLCGNYTAFAATTLPSAPKKLTVTPNKYSGLTIKWNYVQGATGYMIYTYSAADGSWKLLGTTTNNYYHNNKLKQTRNYTYRVRAFVSLDSKSYYGDYCESVSAFYKAEKQTDENILKLEKSGILGYLYDPAEKCFYTSADPWQRNIGYTEAFDYAAPFTLINFDTQRITFKYKNKDWMLQLWKGQYGLVFYGAEAGLYNKSENRGVKYYDCVSDDEMLKMSMDFYQKSAVTGKWKIKFSRPYGYYWWCTGFIPGNVGGKFENLRFVLRVTMKDKEMLDAFRNSIKKTNVSYSVDGLDVYINYR